MAICREHQCRSGVKEVMDEGMGIAEPAAMGTLCVTKNSRTWIV